jgi:hypothetical protein
MKKTEWYPENIKPARKGLYETRIEGSWDSTWSVWSGNHWAKASEDANWAVVYGIHGESHWQDRQWRGLTKPA